MYPEVIDLEGFNGHRLQNDYADESGDFDYFFRSTQEEAAFVDAANWDTSPATVGASDSVIDALPRRHLRAGDAALQKDCSICLNAFGVNVELINLPCMHGFHSACIEQWLQLNASCPPMSVFLIKRCTRQS
ncbi:hypothetical protein BJV82DRAFT_305478 [Fennellomyces sp. T-0311]|nr:hypothetical protein BJV82DRAFT_305478 [Fennellomyces sp. T-0311]